MLGLAKTIAKPEAQKVAESTWKKVYQVVESARSRMKPGEKVRELKCPICSRMTAYVTVREPNMGNEDCVAACSRGCFACFE